MKIVIACGAMPFGPTTLETKSLGGSETAALMLAKSLAAKGSEVVMFCNLDDWPSGAKHFDGVTYMSLAIYTEYQKATLSDLTIIVRDPNLATIYANTRKKVLWMHDVATKRGMQRAFDQMAWAIDEVWTVSEWHRQQVHGATGYPLDFIYAMRNGIVPIDTVAVPRIPKQIIYAARPERGLVNLVRPGGIMDHLPDYTLIVSQYDHYPEHMRAFYAQISEWINARPNVKHMGSLPTGVLRQHIRESEAYIYPTQFEETSCILARECIEQGTPFLTTKVGALPETLGDCGIFFEDYIDQIKNLPKYVEQEVGSDGWCKQFALFFDQTLRFNRLAVDDVEIAMSKRTDLTWDGVADMVLGRGKWPLGKSFSRAWSLMQDGDIIAAKTYLEVVNSDDPPEVWSPPEAALYHEIKTQYPFLLDPSEPGYKSMAEFYDWVYTHKAGTEGSELFFTSEFFPPRTQAIAAEIEKLPAGSRVLEYGCGCGHVLAALAQRFPKIEFVGVDISPAAVNVVNQGAEARGFTNMRAVVGTTDDDIAFAPYDYDAVIISEVLEHVVEPWKLAEQIERYVKLGGKMIATTPFGAWEQMTVRAPGRYHERAHIWHLDGDALRGMFVDKKDLHLLAISYGQEKDHRAYGNTICTYTVDREPAFALDPFSKALQHHPRMTSVACVIAYNNEDTILRMLESIAGEVEWVNIALGPSTDSTRAIIEAFFDSHKYIGHRIINVPKIEAGKFGFDDARKASTTRIAECFDWFLWLDTDEYISGSFRKWLRPSMLQGYVIPQHHFSVHPRGAVPQIDRPARLLRTDAGYEVRGHIHEHFELEGAVGRCFMLPDVDIGHVGYTNENVRQDRFHRNFPFLEWDHNEPGEKRNLHHFLWFRDIVHRMRIEAQRGNTAGAVALAKEGRDYYNMHREPMSTFGPGFQMSNGYMAEIRGVLGMGVPMKVVVQLEDGAAQFEGRFEDYADVERQLKLLVGPEMEARTSRYW